MPAYFFNAPHIWLLARDARDRAKAVIAANPDASAVDAIAAIVLAAAAAEGFINELSELCARPAGISASCPARRVRPNAPRNGSHAIPDPRQVQDHHGHSVGQDIR